MSDEYKIFSVKTSYLSLRKHTSKYTQSN